MFFYEKLTVLPTKYMQQNLQKSEKQKHYFRVHPFFM